MRFALTCLLTSLLMLNCAWAQSRSDSRELDALFADDGSSRDEPDEQSAGQQDDADSGEQAQADNSATDADQSASEAEKVELESAEQTPQRKYQGSGTVLEEIVVTAGKRGIAVDELAGSAKAIMGTDLEDMKAQKLSDFLKLVPGVVLTERGADQNIPVIRGISSSNAGTGNQFSPLAVGIYVDDMPFTDLFVPFSQPDVNPFDLQAVEILNGPQGTLFGSGALSGAIRYVLNKPVLDTWEGKLSATYTFNDQSEGLSPVYAGAVNVPVGQDAALRFVGVSRENSGMYDDVDRGLEDQDKLDQTTLRMLGVWQPTDRLKLSGFYFDQDSEQGQGYANNPMDFYREGSGTGKILSAFSGTNFLLNYEFDAFTFQSSSNYQTKDVEVSALGPVSVGSQQTGDPDGDGGYNGPGTEDAGLYDVTSGYLLSHTNTFFQEFRLYTPPGGDWVATDWLSLNWIAGLAYQRSEQSYEQDSDLVDGIVPIVGLIDLLPVFPLDTPAGPVAGSQDTSYLYAELDSVAEEISIFGEATARLWEDWELTLGARLYKTELDAAGFLSGIQIIALDAGNVRTQSQSGVSEQGINPKFSLRYLFNDNVQTYVLAARGFQFGGVQLNPPVTALALADPANFDSFESSTLWNYEIGLRTEFFDRALRFDITAFYLDWKDMQITVRKPLIDTPATQNIYEVGFIENVGSAESKGVEAALSVKPAEGVTFTTSAYWGHAKTTEFFASSAGDVPSGSRLPNSPNFQMSNVLTYATEAWGGWHTTYGLTHSHIGKAYNDLFYTREVGGYDTVDVSFSMVQPRWELMPELTVSLVNVGDVRGVASVSGGRTSSNYAYYFTRPRSLIMSLGLKF